LDVAAMVKSCLGPAAVSDEVVAFAARAGGVPFLVEELLAAGLTAGVLVADEGVWRLSSATDVVVPATFSESMRRRLARLGDDGRTVVVAAAVLGRRFDWSLVPAITALDEDRALAALHQAVDAQIVTLDRGDGSFRFRHALSRDAVLADLFPRELQTLSRRALAAVEAAHPDLDDDWGQLAAELAAAAGDPRRATTLFLENARGAFERGALATAEATLDRARTLLPASDPMRLDVDECLLRVLSFAGKRERAVEVADSLLARLGNAPQSAPRRAEIHLLLARAAVAATQWDEADEHLERARGETAAAPDARLSARLDAVGAQTAIVDDPERAAALARAALEAAERLDLADVACEALEVLGRIYRTYDLAAAEDAFGRVLVLAEAHGMSLWRARVLHELGAIDMLTGRPLGRLEEARELALAHGALATAAVVDVQVAAALVLADDPEPGARAAQRSADLARRYRLDQTLAAAVALEAYVHARNRRRTELQRCVDEARALAPGVPDIEVKASTASALLALVEEDWMAARRHLLAAVRRAAEGPSYAVVPATGLLALVLQLGGPEGDASDVEFPEASVHFLTSAFLRYADAVAAGHAGDAELAAASMAQADRALDDHRWFRSLGRRLVAEAAVADGWGDPVPWLREALDFFDRHGDDQLASACRSLLRKAGAAVPRRRGDKEVPGELRALGVTSREWEVLRLLAMGLPNKEIATRLYVSPRTVERHVANLAVKTGVGRRSELVAYAARTLVKGTSRS
ncbi:MAG: LuxR C-terminal-related transcriptional regulator, partial [Actinomycetota bacterium]|nr:LuxR C-terminal-related transcriptional regulator [Actinomycetota bacterium]